MHPLRPVPVAYIVLTLMGISLALSAKSSYDTGKTNDKVIAAQVELARVQKCFADFLVENKRVSTVRAEATAAKDEVLNRYVDGVTKLTLNPDPDPGRGQAAFNALTREYRQAAKKLKLERKMNPLPDLPTTCQEIPVPEPARE